MQLNGNTLIDLFERIKDLLRDGRIDIVYNVANRPDLNQKLKQTFKSLADLITAKNNERQFYKNSINLIMEGEQLNIETFANQQRNISSEIKEHAIMLQSYVNSLKQNEGGSAQLRANLEQLENRLQHILSEKEQMENSMQNQIEMLSNENERYREQLGEIQLVKRESDRKSLKISELESQLTSKEAQIKTLSSEYQKSKLLYGRIKQELDTQSLKFSMSISAQSQKLSQIIKQKDEQIDFLKKKLQNDSLNIRSSIFLGQSAILSGNQLNLPASLSEILQRQVGKKVLSMQKLYNYSQQKRTNFHQYIDRKSNILLICQTIHDVLLGAFTTSSFSLNSEPPSTKAFIFGTKEQEISVNRLKIGRESVAYDVDFLIFGNDELCIQKGKNILSSYAPNAISNQLHYEIKKQGDYFAAELDDNGMVQLKNYEIVQIYFAQ